MIDFGRKKYILVILGSFESGEYHQKNVFFQNFFKKFLQRYLRLFWSETIKNDLFYG